MADEQKTPQNPEKIDLVPYTQETVETDNPISAHVAVDSEEDKERARAMRSIYGKGNDSAALSASSKRILLILAIVLISIVLFIAYFLFRGVKDLL